MMITQNIIGFQLSGLSGKKIKSFNPETLEELEEEFVVATSAEVDLAMTKAQDAWRIYRNLPGPKKAEFLRQIADGIEALGDVLVKRIIQETAYPESRIITERIRTCAQLRMFADLTSSEQWREITIDEALPNRSPSPRPELRRMLMPIGPVVIFGASNFPLAYSTMGGDAASALAVGCPVIIKAHESHLGTNALVAEVVMNAAKSTGMPDGVFSSLNGDGMETGKQLVLHPNTAAVGFTGSFGGGKALFDLGKSRDKPIPVFAEMGSVNPIFIFPSALKGYDAELINRLVSSMTMTVGQFCTNPGILTVPDREATNGFLQDLKTALEKIAPASMLNQGIARNFHRGVEEVGQIPSVSLVTSRETSAQEAAPVLALTDTNGFLTNPKLHFEIFGPYSIVVKNESLEEMMKIAENLEGQLTASIFAGPEDADDVNALREVLMEKAGRIIFNGVPTGVEVCPAMTHGGPFPATTDSRFTAVGPYSIRRWLRPVTFQNSLPPFLPYPFKA
ncbi:MAG TPA: aldehyde dehydrogenase (NADP(+)) [Saprospiraceae bacterium]|nr:aldehyde dehydrogenase (NADP(+)) [Saprospiraceae bacterium]